ncbi:uncharacterized protein UV8b_04193 [Ustilaginoidea virens]|uniref:Uncharacterized protein n=1 Tax=Ustilaginoidea virens TaxID=1159556 RepID=A0A8E5MHH4_USTVR|nr:uncharacterized protein UV8b_04193 [Ustilaginoidea virens]QUC19952.1 hypothetical protein UV8b_04193 [Ustilaginoidea virens]
MKSGIVSSSVPDTEVPVASMTMAAALQIRDMKLWNTCFEAVCSCISTNLSRTHRGWNGGRNELLNGETPPELQLRPRRDENENGGRLITAPFRGGLWSCRHKEPLIWRRSFLPLMTGYQPDLA